MSKPDNEIELGLLRQQRIEDWAFQSTFPNPAYNYQFGWALDQFAMNFESMQLRRFKILLIRHFKNLRTQKDTSFDVWDFEPELIDKIKARYLTDRFRVEGFRPGGYESSIVPRPLLEIMSPDVILSELRESDTNGNILRRFENVRIFDLTAEKKTTGGRPPTYDWPALKNDLERESPDIFSDPELITYCRTRAKPAPGKLPSMDGPDDKTVREAITKYGLKKFVKSK